MNADLVIRNARVVRHDGEFHGGVAVKDGKIVLTGADSALPDATRVVDAEGKVLMPGIIDPHCHLGVNFPYAEDMRTETAAADHHMNLAGMAGEENRGLTCGVCASDNVDILASAAYRFGHGRTIIYSRSVHAIHSRDIQLAIRNAGSDQHGLGADLCAIAQGDKF